MKHENGVYYATTSSYNDNFCNSSVQCNVRLTND